MRRLARLLAGASAGVGLAGGALLLRRRSAGRGGAGDDAALVTRVTTLLAATTESSAEIAVSARRGVVTLRGEVDRLIEIAVLEAAVREQPGVKDVENLLRLRVRTPAR